MSNFSHLNKTGKAIMVNVQKKLNKKFIINLNNNNQTIINKTSLIISLNDFSKIIRSPTEILKFKKIFFL